MYFVQDGFIGIAVNQYGCVTGSSSNFEIGRRQEGHQLICDHYVLNKRKSLYNYIALKDVHGYCITTKFTHGYLFKKYKDYKPHLQLESFRAYKIHVWKPMQMFRKQYIDSLNNKNLCKNIQINAVLAEQLFFDNHKASRKVGEQNNG